MPKGNAGTFIDNKTVYQQAANLHPPFTIQKVNHKSFLHPENRFEPAEFYTTVKLNRKLEKTNHVKETRIQVVFGISNRPLFWANHWPHKPGKFRRFTRLKVMVDIQEQ